MTLSRACVLVLLFLGLACHAHALSAQHSTSSPDFSDEALVVQTDKGPIQGYFSDAAREFQGVPYAQPPTGARRFQKPLPALSWAPKILPTQAYKSDCMQDCTQPPGGCSATISEDCLYLNIYTPRNNVSSAPVYVFFPGGNYQYSGASTVVAEGRFFANATGMIVVVVGYRIGAAGFLVTSNFTGNYGLFDQWLALGWVQDNIKNFGGDPNAVTIGGQSAGAMSVSIHLTSPVFSKTNYFHHAIMESNSLGIPFRNIKQQEEVGAHFSKYLGCKETDLACFASKTQEEILTAQLATKKSVEPWPSTFEKGYLWSPCIGREETPDQAYTLLTEGKYIRDVPVIIGTVRDEGQMFVWELFNSPLSRTEFELVMIAVFGIHAKTLMNAYPVPDNMSQDARPVLAEIAADKVFRCPSRRVADTLATAQPNSTYLYFFDHPLSFPAWGPNFAFCEGFVCHGSELAFLFDTASLLNYTMTQQEQALSMTIRMLWEAHARGEAKHGNLLGVWPAWDAKNEINLRFDVPSLSLQQHRGDTICNIWDKIGYV
eukprot:TRINITY_DN772_c0_g1_i2.p1 TRINITY_DN772_c0_g1~~TRINITY_DN772_c0_g1_i2.p1  ORF type:complete len:556 (+),score=150.84 TRINITY_DN772_c0_g1_i2:37-1668(+)